MKILYNIKKSYYYLRNKILNSKVYFLLRFCIIYDNNNQYNNYDNYDNYNITTLINKDKINYICNNIVINIPDKSIIFDKNYISKYSKYSIYCNNNKIISQTSLNYPELHEFLSKDLFIKIRYQEIYNHILKYYNFKEEQKNKYFYNNYNFHNIFYICNSSNNIVNNISTIIVQITETDYINNNYNLYNIIYRLYKYNITRFSTYNLSLLYLDRFFNLYSLKSYNDITFNIFFSICLLIAGKFNDDQPYNNYSYSVVTNIPLHLINKLEIALLQLFDYNLSYNISEINYIKDIIQ